MHFMFTAGALLLASIADAAPAQSKRGLPAITADIIENISPASASCGGAPVAAQCRTAAQAAGPIAQSLSAYKITTPGEAAAIISLMAYESEDFKYQNNMYPGRPGQGTRNMQMITFNVEYADSIPALADKAKAITNGAGATALSTDQANAVRGLLTAVDDYDFGSAAWFLTSQCTQQVRQQLQTGSLAGWQEYLSSCVGTTATADRQAYWSRAIAALS